MGKRRNAIREAQQQDYIESFGGMIKDSVYQDSDGTIHPISDNQLDSDNKILTYESFNNVNIEEEINKIDEAELVSIKIDTKDKGLLFLLGMLFAGCKKINIINKDELDLTDVLDEAGKIKYDKSYEKMAYVWEKLDDFNFPNNDFSNVITDLDKRIENVKRLGIQVGFNYDYDKGKLFLICPVRGASSAQQEIMEMYMKEMENKSYSIHIPHLHTVQTDILAGYTICLQNGIAIGESDTVHLYYDKSSQGSMFDLGMAYYLEKPLVLINEEEIVFDEFDFGDQIVKEMLDRSAYRIRKI